MNINKYILHFFIACCFLFITNEINAQDNSMKESKAAFSAPMPNTVGGTYTEILIFEEGLEGEFKAVVKVLNAKTKDEVYILNEKQYDRFTPEQKSIIKKNRKIQIAEKQK